MREGNELAATRQNAVAAAFPEWDKLLQRFQTGTDETAVACVAVREDFSGFLERHAIRDHRHARQPRSRGVEDGIADGGRHAHDRCFARSC